MMVQSPNATEPQLTAIFRTVQEILRQKINQGDVSYYGVLLIGTNLVENICNAHNIFCILPLTTPSIGAIRTLQVSKYHNYSIN